MHELLRLFPEVRTEDGKIDFDLLQRARGDVVDGGRERYGMVWPGKAGCFKAIQPPSLCPSLLRKIQYRRPPPASPHRRSHPQ